MTELEDGPAPKKSNTLKILGFVGCGCLVLVGGCFAIVGGAAWWGLGKIEEVAMEVLQEEPAVRQHLGELESVSMELIQMAKGDNEVFIFTLEGTKGSGTVRVRESEFDEDARELLGGTLILPDGEEIPLGVR